MTPFEESLQKYLDIFISQETYFVNDKRNLDYFAANPANNNLEEIKLKLSMMDDADFNKLGIADEMARHIQGINLDARLAKGDLSVVEDIARIKINGKEQNLLHFASAYCNLHKPEVFPVFSDQHIPFYKRYVETVRLNINAADLNQYSTFTKALNDFAGRFKVKGKLNYLQMRKFGWLYAEKVLQENDPFKS